MRFYKVQLIKMVLNLLQNNRVRSVQVAEGPIYVGSASRIEPDCEIFGPTWIGHGCHLERGARISRSILFDYSRISSRSRVTESLVFGRNCVDQAGNPLPDLDGTLDWVGDARDVLDPSAATG